METTINGLLAVTIIKLVLDFIGNMAVKRSIEDLRENLTALQLQVIEACTIIKERRAKNV